MKKILREETGRNYLPKELWELWDGHDMRLYRDITQDDTTLYIGHNTANVFGPFTAAEFVQHVNELKGLSDWLEEEVEAYPGRTRGIFFVPTGQKAT